MHKLKIFFLGLSGIFSILYCRAQDTAAGILTLQQSVDIAIKNNLQVQQSQSQLDASKIGLNQSKENLLPFVGAQANQGINFGRSINPYTNQYIDQQINTGNYGINTNLTLFSGLQLINGIRQNMYAYDASKMDWQQQKDNITLNVILAYLLVLSNRDLLDISRAQADVDLKQVQRLEIQYREGAIAPSTLYDLRGQYANDLVNIVNNVNALEASKVGLYQLLNIPYNKNVQLENIAVPINTPDTIRGNSDSIFQTALANLPLIKSADLRVKQYHKALQVARGAFYPTLSFYGSVSTNYSSAAETNVQGPLVISTSQNEFVTVNGGDYYLNSKNDQYLQKIAFGDQFKNNRYTQIGFQLSIPILNYFKARNNVKFAKVNLQNYEHLATATRNQLQQNVELAFQNMIASYGQYKSYVDQVNAFQQSFRSAEIRFNAGAINSVDYVIAKNNYDRANINLSQARYNYILRTKILDYYQGRLTL
ncbi:MAG: TolC family protein [Bacteroidetes bacterium]|nr:MAG: TolC family protein [Bacteroidota bacterium]